MELTIQNNMTIIVLVALSLTVLSYAPNKTWAHPIDDGSLSTLAPILSEDEDSQQSEQDVSFQQEELQSHNSSMIKPSHERQPNFNTTDGSLYIDATERSALIPSREKPSWDISEQPAEEIATTENLSDLEMTNGGPFVTSDINKSSSSFQTTEQPRLSSSAMPIISSPAQPMVSVSEQPRASVLELPVPFVPVQQEPSVSVQPVTFVRPVVYATQRPNVVAHVVQSAPVHTHQYPQHQRTTGFLGFLKNLLTGFLKIFFPFARF